MKRLDGLRKAIKILKEMTCDNCGKRIATLATGFKHAGNGHYNATGFEKRTEETHCTCKTDSKVEEKVR